MAQVQHLEKTSHQTVEQLIQKLVLYNDDYNTFDWVIECLVEICEHTCEQAEQCAWIVHFKGRYPVLHGTYEFLLPRYEALCERGLTVNIE